MKPVIEILDKRITQAMTAATGEKDCPAIVKQSGDPKFGHYQANGCMALAKRAKSNPRELAAKVVENLKIDDICETPEIAGPGFINLTLKTDFLSDRLMEIATDDQDRLAIDKTDAPKKVVVDFSAPNIAKQMHVGHLRSTIIGDCICRMYDFLGNEVIRQNHIGDWGTQFGMLIANLRDHYIDSALAGIHGEEQIPIEDLENFYKQAKERYDSEEEFANIARDAVVKLHNHDPETMSFWRRIVDESRNHYQPIYDMLEVNLHKENECGESFYADKLAGVVEELTNSGVATKSEGAMCAFPAGFANKEGNPLPFIIQKSDGAFLYATTDLAAIKYRFTELKADKIIYVTDARQQLHFQMLFATAKAAGWLTDDVEVSHVTFGTMLGADGRPFKTRSGENIKLRDLLEEAVERAAKVVEAKNPDLSESEKAEIANAVGIGAVKYADFSNNRTTDFIFSFDKSLAMEGNTAPYMQYAYARVKSIERKAADKGIDVAAELSALTTMNLTEPAELELALHLIRYSEAINIAAADCRPNYLTAYLYDLAQKFSTFYNACPVLIAETDKRPTRLMLCALTAKTIAHGLKTLLGIKVVEKM
ncbi:MAG: arginine--tRNA ligase [Phycisphaerae bacterium]|nr:arginine--tRNA ligase [Phycisphaerae bacterium]